jgi:protein SCO1
MRTLLAATLLALTALAGCRSSHQPAPQTASSKPNFKVYHLRGKVVSTQPATGEVTLDHEAIPGFMEAMTMPYKLKDPSILSELHPGDTLTADLLVSQDADATVLLDHIVVIAQGKPDYKPTVMYHVPSPGDAVPDFKLRNQDGRAIHLEQFRGKDLLITFIYTRCPLPNFCPLVTHNFAVISKDLQKDPALYKKTHLLCVSFDPEHDTPARLRAYGAEYLGSSNPKAFSHLEFAVPPQSELDKMAEYFDVGITHGTDGSISHTLSTTLINAQGKVVQFYPGNDWTPEQVIGDLHHLEAKAS